MMDQAETLRQVMNTHSGAPVSIPVLTIGSGRSGSGKSVAAFSIAVQQSKQGKKVLLVELGAQDARVKLAPGIEKLTLNSDLFSIEHIVRNQTIHVMDRIRSHLIGFDFVIVEVNSECDYLVRSLVSPTDMHLIVMQDSLFRSDQSIEVIANYRRVCPQIKQFYVIVNQVTDGTKARARCRDLVKSLDRSLGIQVEYLGYLPKDRRVKRFGKSTESLLEWEVGRPFQRCVDFFWQRLNDRISSSEESMERTTILRATEEVRDECKNT